MVVGPPRQQLADAESCDVAGERRQAGLGGRGGRLPAGARVGAAAAARSPLVQEAGPPFAVPALGYPVHALPVGAGKREGERREDTLSDQRGTQGVTGAAATSI